MIEEYVLFHSLDPFLGERAARQHANLNARI
jgi:hypothetical protein